MKPYLPPEGGLLVAIGVALGILFTVSAAQSAETKRVSVAQASPFLDLRIVAEADNKPWTYSENRRPTGFVTEIVEEIASRLGSDRIEIVMEPWARAYQYLTAGPKTMIFSVGRNANRENLFHWVGPVAIHIAYLYARAGSGLSVNNLEDAKKLGIIGVHRSSGGAQILEQQGFTNLFPVTDDLQNVKMLLRGRIDAMPGVPRNMRRRLNEVGESMESVEPLFIISEAGVYIAFSMDVDSSVVERWQQMLDELKSDGFFGRAEQRWGIN